MAYTCPFCKSTHTQKLAYEEMSYEELEDGTKVPGSATLPRSNPPTYEYACLDCGQVSKTIRHQ